VSKRTAGAKLLKRPGARTAQLDRADRKAAKSERKTAKIEQKTAKQQAKAAKKGELGRITPGNAKRVIKVLRIVGPAVAPVVWSATAAVRERYDRLRARRLGVPVDDIGSFTGKGAKLHARLAGDAAALRDLQVQTGAADPQADQYAEQTLARLDQLSSAVRAAERMPAGRRRSAHRSVHRELDRIEEELLSRFGVRR
jgi:hypothetical protein